MIFFPILNNIKIASYPDDNGPDCYYKNLEDFIQCLERIADGLFTCFNNNGMKADADNAIFS